MPGGRRRVASPAKGSPRRARASDAAGEDRYGSFLALSGLGIARFEIDPPVDTAAPEDEQVARILGQGRIRECNAPFARLYDRHPDDLVGRAVPDFVALTDDRVAGIRQFVRSGYRLVDGEEVHANPDGTRRWMRGSALGLVGGGRLRAYWLTLADITAAKQAEQDRETRGRILEAVAFGAARLLAPGRWRDHADEVLARLGTAADAARVYLAEATGDGADVVFPFAWARPGVGTFLEELRDVRSLSEPAVGLARLERELRAGRPVVTRVKDLPEPEQAIPRRVGSRSFAMMPVFAEGRWWGFLGLGETRFDRQWSAPEVEGLKAAAAVFGAAIERERADDALLEVERRFERLAAAAFEGIAVTDAGVFIDANEQLARMLGWSVGELVGRRVEEFVAEEDRERVEARFRAGSEEPYEHRARRRDGSSFPVAIQARSMPYAGRSVRVTAVRDVSERVQAEERRVRLEGELRQAAEQWRQTFDALDLGIVLADAEGKVVRLNRTALDEAAGAGYAEAVGRSLRELPPREPWLALAEVSRRVAESGGSAVAQTQDPATGRSFYLLGSPWARGEGAGLWVVFTFRDVTDFTAMQEQLRRARTMEAMGSLVAGVAHEVRNPLFSISATVDALESDLGLRPEFAEYAGLLRSQVKRLTQLMRDLLDYGKSSVLHRQPTRLADVARRAIRSCAALAREREVAVVSEVDVALPLLDVDGARLEQALQNLVANAVQHTPRGAGVVVRGAVLESGPERRACCLVEDEGPGIPEADLPQLFEPFFSRRKGGTGLGLSIVQRVAEAHGGDVVAENRPGAGARFTLRLPLFKSGGPSAGGGDA